jgi:TctA family transporter
VQRPISLVFLILTAGILAAMVVPAIRKKKEQAVEEGGSEEERIAEHDFKKHP